MEKEKNYYEILLSEALTAVVLTAEKLGYLKEGYPEFLKNLEDLWILDMTKLGLKIKKEDDPINAVKSFVISNIQNEEIIEILSDVEEISVEQISKNSIDFEVKRCPFMELHHVVAQVGVQEDMCLIEGTMCRWAERSMMKKEPLNHTFEFNLPEKPCKIHFEKK